MVLEHNATEHVSPMAETDRSERHYLTVMFLNCRCLLTARFAWLVFAGGLLTSSRMMSNGHDAPLITIKQLINNHSFHRRKPFVAGIISLET